MEMPTGTSSKRRRLAAAGRDAEVRVAGATLVANMTSRLRRDQNAVIEIPSGLRLKVDYGAGAIGDREDPDVVLTKALGEHEGRIASGSDWVLVRTDGVILVDARVTVFFESVTRVAANKAVREAASRGTAAQVAAAREAAEKEPAALMDMTFKGMIDLKKTFGVDSGADAYRHYCAGDRKPLDDLGDGLFGHEIVGSVRFEGGRPNGSFDYTDHFQRSVRGFGDMPHLELLTRQQFAATGKVKVRMVPHYDPEQIELSVFGWGL